MIDGTIIIKRRKPAVLQSIFFKFLTLSLVFHGIFICVVCAHNEKLRKNLLNRVRKAIPIKVVFYDNIPLLQKSAVPRVNLLKKPVKSVSVLKEKSKKIVYLKSRKNPVKKVNKIMVSMKYKPRRTVKAKKKFKNPGRVKSNSRKKKVLKDDYIPLPSAAAFSNPPVKIDKTPATPAKPKRRRVKKLVVKRRIAKAVPAVKKVSVIPPADKNPEVELEKPKTEFYAFENKYQEKPVQDTPVPLPTRDAREDLPVENPVLPDVSSEKEVKPEAVSHPVKPVRVKRAVDIKSEAGDPEPVEKPVKNPLKNRAEKKPSRGELRRRLSQFRGIVAGRIESVKVYPHEARRERQEGKVVISFVISPTGNIGSINIVRSSGFSLLDRAATEAAGAGAPYLPFPKGLTKPIRIKMTVNFKIT